MWSQARTPVSLMHVRVQGDSAPGSAEMWADAGDTIADLLAHAEVDVVLVEAGRLGEADSVGLVVDCGHAAEAAADVRIPVLLADLTVDIGDGVVRARVHVEEADDLGDDTSLLQKTRARRRAPLGKAHLPVSRRRWSNMALQAESRWLAGSTCQIPIATTDAAAGQPSRWPAPACS